MHLKQFLKNNTILNKGNLNSDQKMAIQRQQLPLIHYVTNGSDERTQFDLLQNHLNYLHDHDAEHFYEAHAFKVMAFMEKAKGNDVGQVDLESAFPTALIGDFEPLCHSMYETCQGMEPTFDDMVDFKTCMTVSANKPLNSNEKKSYISMGKKPFEARNSTQLPFDRRHDELPSTSAQARSKQVHENSLNIANFLQPGRNQKSDAPSTDASNSSNVVSSFRTAREELIIQNAKNKNKNVNNTKIFASATKRSLGGRRTVKSAFVPPFTQNNAAVIQEENQENLQSTDERLLNIDPKMIELIENEIMHKFKPIDWHEIAGLEYAKSIIKEAIVYPLLRPDIFTGLRRPPRGILLFGPPGTGKTLIGKCIASQSNATFFSISASSLTSKWIGESEKMVRALFAVATVKQPSVVFIDEIDSLLSQRSDNEHESSRRLKTEFLVQLDGAATCEEDRVLIVGATNRPQELDEAARRRLVRRLYIPLPECGARCQILMSLLQTVRNNLSETDLLKLSELTEGYSGADMKTLCHEASMEPIRSIPAEQIPFFKADTVRAVSFADFNSAMERVRPSVSQSDLKQYIDWNKIYGACK